MTVFFNDTDVKLYFFIFVLQHSLASALSTHADLYAALMITAIPCGTKQSRMMSGLKRFFSYSRTDYEASMRSDRK